MKAPLALGHVYAGRVELEGFERFASRGQLEEKFVEAGFSHVSIWDNDDVSPEIPGSLRVEGSGVRYARGTWTGADVLVELPDQVKAIVDVTPRGGGGVARPPGTPANSLGGAPGAPLAGTRATPVRLNVATLPPALESDFIFIALAARLGAYFL